MGEEIDVTSGRYMSNLEKREHDEKEEMKKRMDE